EPLQLRRECESPRRLRSPPSRALASARPCRLLQIEPARSHGRRLPLAATAARWFQRTKVPRKHQRFHARQPRLAAVPFQTIPLRDRQPPSVRNAANDIRPSFLNPELSIPGRRDSTVLFSKEHRCLGASL